MFNFDRAKKGSELCAQDQEDARRAFVHRYTAEHTPEWAKNAPKGKGEAQYSVQFKSDRDWLENTLFEVNRDGRLRRSATMCLSSPTWPNNPELRNPLSPSVIRSDDWIVSFEHEGKQFKQVFDGSLSRYDLREKIEQGTLKPGAHVTKIESRGREYEISDFRFGEDQEPFTRG